MDNIDQQIRDYYDSVKLGDRKAQSILDSGEAVAQSRRTRMISLIGLAAAAAITIMTLIFVQSNTLNPQDMALSEIAMNHKKGLGPEIATDDYLQLQSAMDKLEFSIIPGAHFIKENFELLGGRYCSVCGVLAAQLKLLDKATGKPCTLYIAKQDEPLQSIQSSTQVVDGVHIQLWTHGTRLFAMAR